MKRYFVCHIIPVEITEAYNLSYASGIFCGTLIDAELFDEVYSIPPSAIRETINERWGKVNIVSSRNRGSSTYRHRWAIIEEQWKVFKEIKPDTSVWFYNLTTLTFLLFILLKLFKPSVRLNTIVLDYNPSYWIDKLMLPLINNCDGQITLSTNSRFTCRNRECIPGVVNITASKRPKIIHVNKVFLVSGVLSEEISMISMLISAFKKMPELTLHIVGISSNPEMLNNCGENIHYHGRVPSDQYQELLNQSTFVLSTRNPLFSENRNNFPSKIIEALQNNRIVISTIFYEQLKDFKYFTIPCEEKTFITGIHSILSMREQDLLTYCNQSDLVSAAFGQHIWKEAMNRIDNT